MREVEFTKGKWVYSPGMNAVYAHENGEYSKICDVFRPVWNNRRCEDTSLLGPEFADPDGHLISAAPDMYRALVLMQEMLGGDLLSLSSTESFKNTENYRARKAMEDAIAKAEGKEVANG